LGGERVSVAGRSARHRALLCANAPLAARGRYDGGRRSISRLTKAVSAETRIGLRSADADRNRSGTMTLAS
jgi:hypothetical protein